MINTFQTKAPFLYTLKISKDLLISDISGGGINKNISLKWANISYFFKYDNKYKCNTNLTQKMATHQFLASIFPSADDDVPLASSR